MGNLWQSCVCGKGSVPTAEAASVIQGVGYDATADGENIEGLLSRCEAFLQVNASPNVKKFVESARKSILEECSGFLGPDSDSQLAAHRTFLHKLSRRRTRDSRLKVFTTNYDVCFESAASKQGLIPVDGFSFTQPRTFDPRFFSYDIVRRPLNGEDSGAPLEGVFLLFKLHGSVDWVRSENADVVIGKPSPESACLIYPARGKYQQSYVQPHLELISQYLSSLRNPNTCVIVTGFGFQDDHLSEPILSAVKTNPHLRLVVVDPWAHELVKSTEERHKYWRRLFDLAGKGSDVWLISATFGVFADLIPDLKALTPAERISRDIKQIAAH
ncbi:SIR2 family protein [Caenimonas sedimenti]|nr:SIR2 family protein [Caenimonas sedimenti]